MNDDELLSAAARLVNEMFTTHGEHPWHQVGRCVYCGPCGTRLYQGRLPEGHPVWTPPRKPNDADRMRQRWDMDRRPS